MNSHFWAVVGRMECGCQDEGDGGKLWDVMRCSRFLFSGVESVGTGSCGILLGIIYITSFYQHAVVSRCRTIKVLCFQKLSI